MFNGILGLGFGVLLLLGLIFIVYPLRQFKGFAILIIVVYIGAAIVLYQYWGGLNQFRTYQQKLDHAQTVKKLAAQYTKPEQLIQKLRSKLDDTPQSAQGWYLLGKLYGAQGNWREAHQAFSKAQTLKPDSTEFAIQDIYARWMLNHQRLNHVLRQELHLLLRQFPNQPDILMLLAMDAFETQHYQQAIDYWNILLPQTPAESEARLKVQEAIAKASAQIRRKTHDTPYLSNR